MALLVRQHHPGIDEPIAVMNYTPCEASVI